MSGLQADVCPSQRRRVSPCVSQPIRGISGALHSRLGYTCFMEVTLTPQAEQLLRDALARSPGSSAAEIVEHALAGQLPQINGVAINHSLRERLASLPGV